MSEEKVMYAASLVQGELVIREVNEGVYNRIGTDGLCRTKEQACEALKLRIMDQFMADMRCVDWQARQFIKTL